MVSVMLFIVGSEMFHEPRDVVGDDGVRKSSLKKAVSRQTNFQCGSEPARTHKGFSVRC
ncbi:hypothetical protein EMIT0P171_40194 [Pseudomonas sp. IT-P171]